MSSKDWKTPRHRVCSSVTSSTSLCLSTYHGAVCVCVCAPYPLLFQTLVPLGKVHQYFGWPLTWPWQSNNGIPGTLNSHVAGRATGLMRECHLGFTVQVERANERRLPLACLMQTFKEGVSNSTTGALFSQPFTSLFLCPCLSVEFFKSHFLTPLSFKLPVLSFSFSFWLFFMFVFYFHHLFLCYLLITFTSSKGLKPVCNLTNNQFSLVIWWLRFLLEYIDLWNVFWHSDR